MAANTEPNCIISQLLVLHMAWTTAQITWTDDSWNILSPCIFPKSYNFSAHSPPTQTTQTAWHFSRVCAKLQHQLPDGGPICSDSASVLMGTNWPPRLPVHLAPEQRNRGAWGMP